MSAPAGGDKKNIVKMAYIYFQEGRWDKAIEEYKKLIALDPEDVNTHNMMGDVYVKKGSPREAFDEYIKVSADFSSRGQNDKAAIVNKKIASLDSSLLPAEAQKKQSLIKQTIKAESAMEQGDMDGAIAALTEVLKLDSENLSAFYKLAELFEKKGQIPEAIKQYEVLGSTFLKNRLYKKSQEMYQKVTLLDPGNTEAHVNLAQIFLKQGSEREAKKEYLSAAEQALSRGDLENANSYAAKAVELKSIEAHFVLAMVLMKKQKLTEARAEFEELLRYQVKHVEGYVNLGRVLLALNQEEKASQNIQKALTLEKENPSALEVWVELCIKKGNKKEAATHLMKLMDLAAAKPDDEKTAQFARSLISLDDSSVAAHSKLSEALKQKGDKNGAADAYFKLALLHEKLNHNELMMEAVRKALELNPNHTEAQKRVMGDVTSHAAPIAVSHEKVPTPAVSKAPAPGVVDLEQEIQKPFSQIPKQAKAPEVHEKPAPAPEPAGLDSLEELKAQISIAENYLKQGLVEEAIEVYQQLAEAHPENAEVKQKLNQAYTAYVKTGDEVIGALEAEKKAKEDEEKRLRAEMEVRAQEEAKRLREELEQKARLEADIKARVELEKKAREEAEKKAREEMERLAKGEEEQKIRLEAERRAKEESERKTREEADRKLREETEKKVREEIAKKMEQEAKKASVAHDQATARTPPTSKGDVLEENRDDFMTIAVADIYVRQQLYEEAVKIYRRIVQMEPDNLEAKKKLGDTEAMIKSKGSKPASEPSATTPMESTPSKPAENHTPPPHSSGPEKDSGGKKKSNRVGYV